jgi:beta-galactosidase GanA
MNIMSEPKEKTHLGHPATPFPVGTEYYRAPMPPQDFWDQDFAAIRAAGMRIVRSFTYWNWIEPQPGRYELDDIDRFFELAAKHDLMVWLDLTLATHGACPEWLTREHPDIRAVRADGFPAQPSAGSAYPQGSMIHCYDHPKWKEYGEGLLRAIVSRYKDAPNLIMWGLWDGVNLAAAWGGDSYPCYCDSTLGKYDAWLQSNFTLDTLNERCMRRYRDWADVFPPRDNNNVVEMLLYRQFHYQNLAGVLRWQRAVVESIDDAHEIRAHGAHFPRPWDEICAPEVDSWGMSMSSNNLLTADDDNAKIANHSFSFDWSRSVGRNGRWWNEEIYSGMSPAGVTWKKQSDPAELTTLLWMSLANGAAGSMFWQYTPEYLSFEAPGYCLTAPDRTPTPRLTAVSKAIAEIDLIADHLPLEIPKAEVAVVYSWLSQEIFEYNNQGERYLSDLRGVYRTLWENNIPVDIVSPAMDWSGYKVIYLPNAALLDSQAIAKIKSTIDNQPETHLIADGNFGSYAETGHYSYQPPEGLAAVIEASVADYSMVNEKDIADGNNLLKTPYGKVRITGECGYSVIKTMASTKPIAHLGDQVVGVETADRRLTWFGFSLSTAFDDAGSPELVLPLFDSFSVGSPFAISGDNLIAMRRRSKLGGWLVFLFNLELEPAHAEVTPQWDVADATDLLAEKSIGLSDGSFPVSVEPGGVKVVYCSVALS